MTEETLLFEVFQVIYGYICIEFSIKKEIKYVNTYKLYSSTTKQNAN